MIPQNNNELIECNCGNKTYDNIYTCKTCSYIVCNRCEYNCQICSADLCDDCIIIQGEKDEYDYLCNDCDKEIHNDPINNNNPVSTE